MSKETVQNRIDNYVAPSVFICYSRDDVKFVERLDEELQAHNIDVDIDLRFEITPDYKKELYEKILAADIFLFIISPTSVDSNHCKDEITYAVEHNKRILAVMHKDEYDATKIPEAINKPEWIFMRNEEDIKRRVSKLVAAIKTDFELMQMHTSLLLRADEWEKHSFNKHLLLKGNLLKAAQEWLPKASNNVEQLPNPTELQTKYIIASQRARTSFIRVAAITVMAIALILTTLGVVALVQAQQKETALELVKKTNSEKEEEVRKKEDALKEKQDALTEKQEALVREQTAIQGREEALQLKEEEQRLKEEAQKKEQIALEEKKAALESERKSVLAKAQAEIEKKKADALAELEKARAEREVQVSKANKTVLVGERLVEKDPARAIAFGFASENYSSQLAAQTMIRRAVLQLPEYQSLQVEDRIISDRPEVLPSNFAGVKGIYFAHDGEVIIVHHLDGTVSTWSVYNGTSSGNKIGSQNRPVIDLIITKSRPTRIIALFKDGTIEQHQLQYDAGHVLITTNNGYFAGIVASADKSRVMAWDKEGRFSEVVGVGLPSTLFYGKPIINCTIGKDGKQLVCLTESGELFQYNLSNGTQSSIGKSDIKLSANQEQVNQHPDKYSKITLYLQESTSSLLVGHDFGDKLSKNCGLEVFDLIESKSVWKKTLDHAACAVDERGGKLAFLTTGKIEQFKLIRSDTKLAVTEFGNWDIISGQSDTGESQAIAYGPFGEYLLTANAPILTLVGPPPATVKLWYANPYADSRAVDLHRGKLIGSQSKAVLNIAFDSDGRRIAAFNKDGKLKIWNIFPEQAISLQTKADDYFNNYYHIPLSTRALLNTDFSNTENFIASAQDLFRINLDSKEIVELDAALNAQESTETILNRLEDYTPPSIALQWFEGKTYDETPNLIWELPKGYSPSTGEYNPLKDNEPLSALIDDIVNQDLRDERHIINRYIKVVEKDPLLLSGLQIPSLVSRLQSTDSNERASVYIMLALSGDSSVIQILRNRVYQEADSKAKTIGNWSISFLENQGRDLSLNGDLALHPQNAQGKILLSLPKLAIDNGKYLELLALLRNEEMVDVVLSASEDKNISPSLALFTMVNLFIETTPTQQKYNFVIMLRDREAYDAALAWGALLLDNKTPDLRNGVIENTYGYLLYLKGQYEASIKFFKLSAEAGRADGWAERNWGNALQKLGREKEAQTKFEEALKKVEAGIEIAKRNRSKEEFNRIFERLRPEIAGFYNELAWHIVISKEVTADDLIRAKELALKACELTNNEEPNYLDTLAHTYAATQDFSKAIETEKRAIDLLPPSATDTRTNYERKISEWSRRIK
jgi:WD40 repeat protein